MYFKIKKEKKKETEDTYENWKKEGGNNFEPRISCLCSTYCSAHATDFTTEPLATI